ncbi:cupin domain-containing protein [Adhaeribacter radiodurans]|uniref:Cupin domain-containing protein n=1 Tax=Adhaeribacter radiodurans TaxID=2745197 RepID=A0A7L7L8S7_9BACT|nr:cupin domain-containing protein [Adhaeribacter radiodurans]QMU29143.1 cupin domain-containing protein [Adhaeribacter radiodurans]
MKDHITEYIESGILELYLMGLTSEAENEEVEQLAASHLAIRQELDSIQNTMEQYATAHAVTPRPLMKSLFVATVDYMQRLEKGETVTHPPLLNNNSHVQDYAAWLNREDMVLPANSDSVYIKLIGYTPAITTAIVWLQDNTDNEVHDKEYERFLIVEGTCTITAGEDSYTFGPGDYYEVPLYTSHVIQVTSAQPCKVVLQRVAVE